MNIKRYFAVACVLGSMLVTARTWATDAGQRWVTVWSASPSNSSASPHLSRVTVRQFVTPSLSGTRVRIRLSNRLSGTPTFVSHAYIGRQSRGAALVAGSNQPLTFNGQTLVTIPAGGEVYSDPLDFPVKAFEKLGVSLYFPHDVAETTRHFFGFENWYAAKGNFSADASDSAFRYGGGLDRSRIAIAQLDIVPEKSAGVLVTVGDSLTDGFTPNPNFAILIEEGVVGRNERYPDYLARRLQADARFAGRLAVANAGISGNRLLSDTLPVLPIFGPSVINRLDADVLGLRGVTDVIAYIGINDVNMDFFGTLKTAAVLDGYRRLIQRITAQGINLQIATLTPTKGSVFHNEKREQTRQQINQWLRTHLPPAMLVDFDRCVRDGRDPARIAPEYASGDKLHFNSAGHRRLAECVELDRLCGGNKDSAGACAIAMR